MNLGKPRTSNPERMRKTLTRSRFLAVFTNTRPTQTTRAAAGGTSPSEEFSSDKQVQANQQHHLLSLLSVKEKPPRTHKSTCQIHSRLLTSGLLLHSLPYFNALLRYYSLGEFPHHSLFLYRQLQQAYFHSLEFDSFTYTFLINASTNCCSPVMGTQFHGLTFKVGFHCHVYVQTALVKLYSSTGALADALLVFDEMPERNSVAWNVMITGLVKWGEVQVANTLFDEMPNRNVVSWTGIIDGYIRMNRFKEGLALFRRMASCECVVPNQISILTILPGISNTGDLENCTLIHGYGEKRGFNAFDIRLANSMVDTYAKCGCIASAARLFEEISGDRKNLVSWTSIISGFAMHGMGKEAVEYFERMERVGFKPNRVTLLSVLNACSHGGLIEEGLSFFQKMVNEYGVQPDIKHYGCVIDMLGRTGRLEEAETMALAIPTETINAVIWRTLLGACSFHGNVERVTRKLMEVERGYGGDYVLMHNIFAGVGRFEDAQRLRRLLDKRKAFKVPGCSLV